VTRPVAIIVHSYYEEDPRMRRQAESLVAAGRPVDVFSLRRPGDGPKGDVAGVRVTRLDVQRHQGSPIGTYLQEYMAFLVRVTFALARAHRRRHYAVVQVATPPDFLVAAALPVRLTGVPVILDLHEATPEFFRSRFPRQSNRLTIAALTAVERISAVLADRVLSVNEARHERLLALGLPARKLDVVRNGPVLARFDPSMHERRPFMVDGTLRLAYAGAITPLYGLEDPLDAVAILRKRRPDLPVTLDYYGRGDMEATLHARTDALGLGDRVTLHGRIPHDTVAAALAACDIILSPIRHTRFSEISLSTKVYEGAVMDKPVVAAEMPAARAEFDDAMLSWYRPDDPADLARAIEKVVDDPAWRERALPLARERATLLSWDSEAPRYLAMIESLATGGISSPADDTGNPQEVS
jgi:glycosyltransferase involved in cell wall biosynthesis